MMRAPVRTLVLALVLGTVLMSGASACASAQQKTEKARAKDPKYQYNLGLVYLNQSNLDPANIDKAIAQFQKSLSLDPQYYLAWNALGMAHSLKGDLQRSADAYRKCLEIYPGFTEAHNNLGTIYQESNQFEQAEAEFLKALQDPVYQTRELPFFNLARLYFIQNRLDLALDNVQKAIQTKPRLAMAHNLKGMILEKQGNLTEALAAYQQAVKIVPEDVLFNYNLGAAYYKAGEFAKSKEVFLKISPLATDPDLKVKIAQYLKDLAGK
jgi:tetratricopeptide (TPR) repeat protein